MEDRFFVSQMNTTQCPYTAYGVFDGHGGFKAAQYCVNHLPITLRTELTKYQNPSKVLPIVFSEVDRDYGCVKDREFQGILVYNK